MLLEDHLPRKPLGKAQTLIRAQPANESISSIFRTIPKLDFIAPLLKYHHFWWYGAPQQQ